MVDLAVIKIKAGNGGNGMVHFLTSKHQPKGGPDGGDGGDGGSVVLKTDENLNTLSDFRYRKKFEADKGADGFLKKMSGKKAEDLVIKLPVGTLVKWTGEDGTEKVIDLDEKGRILIIARGGKGGRGNWHFRSATNQTPKEAEKGTLGEEKELTLELKLLADVGLIGLPNAGKSTLLSVLTKAHPVIADYPFTTLEPNLGVFDIEGKERKSVVIADIPGLIEGASEGKGLGDDFLRHVERTTCLIHLIAGGMGKSGKDLLNDYQIVRKELGSYSKELLKKEELVLISKTDVMSEEEKEEAKKEFAKKKIKVELISSVTGDGVETIKRWLMEK